MQLKGKIKKLAKTVTFDSGFTKREMVITTDEQYPQDLKVEFVKDKCAVLDSYNVGDSVTIDINLRGSEYNGRYFVNIQGWRITKLEVQPKQEEVTESEDDLPF